MSTFPYPPLDLDQNSIRLLHVNKGVWPKDVYCSLVEATTNPDEAVPYKALSYTWGDVEGEKAQQLQLPRIFVNNQLFPATDNLRMALSHIQDPNYDIMLWADAICINQQDNREKGHQVKQMAHIYKNAEEVLIWLGPYNEEIRDLLEFATSVDQQAIGILTPRRSGKWASHCLNLMDNQYKDAKTPQNISALKQLMGRRWFKRIWVLQEVAMARSARILCGSSSCPARTFSLMPSFFKIPTTEHSQAVLDLMPRIRSHTWWARDRTLHNLLVKFQRSQATHSRDMIYALLSMSQDACDSTRFYPSYEIEADQVPRNAASFLIFGQMHALRSNFPDVAIGRLALPLAELVELLLKPTLRDDRSLENTFREYHTLEIILSHHDMLERTSHRGRTLKEFFRKDNMIDRSLEETSREYRTLKGIFHKYRTLEVAFSVYCTLEKTSHEYRTLKKVLSQYDTLKTTFLRGRMLKKVFRKDNTIDRTLERAYSKYQQLEAALHQYRKSLLSEIDESLSAFTKRLQCIDLDPVQILHCLSTFLSIALTSPRSLKAWFRIRAPKLLTAKVRAQCSGSQARTKEKPESILTLIFKQQGVQEKYRLMEFPIFDRFDGLERLRFPEDFDLQDRRDGYDSFKRFTALLDPINQRGLTKYGPLA
ncbi:Ff.00g022790.m01.CDS01 [Fusarium sp. VM40]|nr:Ff.00g022790.m01.CDS01 [Fusarium sp. VM40]